MSHAPASNSSELPWLTGDLDVLTVMRQRVASGSTSISRDDGHHVALVVEGGGMRGAYIGGMVRILSMLGVRDAIDEIFAVSAGAFTSTGLILGNVEHSVTAYSDHLAPGGFVSWPRFLTRRGPLISLDFLIDDVMTRRLPVDFAALSTALPPLRPIATDIDALAPIALSGMTTAEEWKTALRASGTVPLYAGGPVLVEGKRYLDGFIADSLPIARAIAAGATHVLALISRASGEPLRTARPTLPLTRARYEALAPGLADLMARRAASYAESLAILGDARHPLRRSARVLGIRPTHRTGVGSLTTDPVRLRRAGSAGEDAVALAWSVSARLAADSQRAGSVGR